MSSSTIESSGWVNNFGKADTPHFSFRNIKLSEALSVIERPSMVFYDTITGCNIALASWKSKPDKQLLVSYIFEEQEIKIILYLYYQSQKS
jgi:hypothetical protein